MSTSILQLESLSKTYDGVVALDSVDITIEAGEIRALCGENGAGKSTLIKCLSGVVEADSGSIRLNGSLLSHGSVTLSEAAGVAVLHQESTAFPDLSSVSNVFAGREIRRAAGLLLDHAAMRRETRALLRQLNEEFPIDVPLRELSTAQRQMVCMARALSRDCRVLILDEPTASLSARESETLMRILKELAASGVAVIYVTHRLDEVFSLADSVTVLRDGQHVSTTAIDEISKDELISQMVGRSIDTAARHTSNEVSCDSSRGNRDTDASEPAFSVRELSALGRFHNVSFDISPGEVVGLAGLVGAGRSEVARAIFGIDDYDSGGVTVRGRALPPNDVAAAISFGIAFVPEDRQHEGLLLDMPIRQNLSMAVLKRLTRFGLIDARREQSLSEEKREELFVKAASDRDPASALSGGNQQKIVLGKWLATEPSVLILDEPTRGIDVGARQQIHQLIRELADSGEAVLLISSDLPEVLAISDRTLVMREGTVSGELPGHSATQEDVLRLALPVEAEASAAG